MRCRITCDSRPEEDSMRCVYAVTREEEEQEEVEEEEEEAASTQSKKSHILEETWLPLLAVSIMCAAAY